MLFVPLCYQWCVRGKLFCSLFCPRGFAAGEVSVNLEKTHVYFAHKLCTYSNGIFEEEEEEEEETQFLNTLMFSLTDKSSFQGHKYLSHLFLDIPYISQIIYSAPARLPLANHRPPAYAHHARGFRRALGTVSVAAQLWYSSSAIFNSTHASPHHHHQHQPCFPRRSGNRAEHSESTQK